MANNKITAGAGLRKGIFLLSDEDGYPDGDQSGAAGYAGVDISGIKQLTLNIPENQRIQHTGDDITFAQDFLPPTELPNGTFTTGKSNQTLDAILSNTLVQAIGDAELDAFDTSEAGNEPDGIMLYYRQAILTEGVAADGARRWQTYILPRVRITPQGNSPAQGGDDVNNYSMTPTRANKAPWGVTFNDGTNGYESAVRLRLTGDYPRMMERWTGNAVLTTFNLEYTPISTTKTNVWVNGTPATVSSVSVANKTMTLSGAPADQSIVVALYETTDRI